MRVSIAGVRTPTTEIAARFDGRPLAGRPGETVAAALVVAGDCQVFCGMGVCQECLVTVDGEPGRRACMTALQDGMEIGPQPALPRLDDVPDAPRPETREVVCDVLE